MDNSARVVRAEEVARKLEGDLASARVRITQLESALKVGGHTHGPVSPFPRVIAMPQLA